MSADLATSCQDLTAHPVLDAVEDYRDTLDSFLQSNCRRWLEALLGTALPPGAPLAELLRSGRLLAEVARVVEAHEAGNAVHEAALAEADFGSRRTAAVYTDIHHFLQLCRRLGLRGEDAPTTPDIVEGRHTPRVLRALWSVAQACEGRGIRGVPEFAGREQVAQLRRAMGSRRSRVKPQAYDVGATGAWLATLVRARTAQRTLSAPPAALCGVPWVEGVGSPHLRDAQQPDVGSGAEHLGGPGSPAPAGSPRKLSVGRGGNADAHYSEAGRGLAPATPPKDPPAAAARGSPLHSPEPAGVGQGCRRGDGVPAEVATASQAARAWLSRVDAAPGRPDRALRGSDQARPQDGAEAAVACPTGRAGAAAEVAAACEVARAWLGGVGAAAAGADGGSECSSTSFPPVQGHEPAEGLAQSTVCDQRRQHGAECMLQRAGGAETVAASAGDGSRPQRHGLPSRRRGKRAAWPGPVRVGVAAVALSAGLLALRRPPGLLPAGPTVGRRGASTPERRRRGEKGAPSEAGVRQDRPRLHIGLWWPIVPLY